MKTSKFTPKETEALEFVSTLNVFAAKVAATILTNGRYSEKQAKIVNETILRQPQFTIENTLFVDEESIHEINTRRAKENLPSSMR